MGIKKKQDEQDRIEFKREGYSSDGWLVFGYLFCCLFPNISVDFNLLALIIFFEIVMTIFDLIRLEIQNEKQKKDN